MPNAAKLVSAVCFAALAWLTAAVFLPHLQPPETAATWFKESCAVIGVFVGWFVLGRAIGRSKGRGRRDAIWHGISSSVILLFWVDFAFSFREMILRSLDKRYRSPVEALGDMIELMIIYFKMMASVDVFATLLIGGMISALFAQYAKQRWN